MTSDSPPVSPERLMQMSWGFAAPLALEAAVRLQLFGAVAEGAHTADLAAAATGASRRGVAMLMDAMATLGFLEKSGDAYALTPESEAFLVPGRPHYRGEFLSHLSTHLVPAWLHLADAVRSGRPVTAVNQEQGGTPFFADFVESLFASNYEAAKTLGAHLGVAGRQATLRVLDIAAGSGVWSIALAEQSPHVEVTAVDWEGVLPVTRRVAERRGVAARYRFVPGDIQKAPFGSGFDVALLGHILHTEGEARSRALLARCFEAMAPGGVIAIAEFLVSADRTGPPIGLLFALNMLLHSEAGGTYSFEEIADWLRAAGFVEPRLLEAPAPAPLVLATKPR